MSEELNQTNQTPTEEGRNFAEQPANENEQAGRLTDDGQVEQTEETNLSDIKAADSVELPKEDDPKGVVKRINKLTARAHEAERTASEARQRLAALEAQLASLRTGQPQEIVPPTSIDQFENWKDYVKANEQYWQERQKEEQRELALQQQEEQIAQKRAYIGKLQENFQKQAEAASEKYEDFHAVVHAHDNPVSVPMAEAFQSSAYGAEIAYYLGKNRAEAERIYKLNPVDAALAIGRLESQFAMPAPKVVSNAPKPTQQVSGGGVPRQMTLKEAEKLSASEYLKIRDTLKR